MKTNKPARFLLVGVINTAIDFGIFTTLVLMGLPVVIANYPATTIALVFSFFANKNYTFVQGNRTHPRQLVLFVVVTLSGLWVVQPIVMYISRGMLYDFINDDFITSIAAKIAATCVSLVWNYIFYRYIVFRASSAQ